MRQTLPRSEAARPPQHSETEAGKRRIHAQERQRSGVAGPPDASRLLAETPARQAIVLQMQRTHGNNYTRRAIERSRNAANRPDPPQTSLTEPPGQKRIGPPGAARALIRLQTVTRRSATERKSSSEAETDSSLRDRHTSEVAENAPPQRPHAFASPPETPPDPHYASALHAPSPDGSLRSRRLKPPLYGSAGSRVAASPARSAPQQKALRRSAAAPSRREPVIQRSWLDDASEALSDKASSVAGTVSDAVSSAAQSVSDVASDVAGAVSDAATGVLTSVLDTLTSAFNAVLGKVTGAWDSVKTQVTDAAEGALQAAIGFLGGLGSLLGSVASALASLDVGVLKTAWAGVTGAAELAVAGVRRIVAGVTSTVDGLWAGVKGLADGAIAGLRSQAEELIGHLPSAVQGAARSAWATFEERLTSSWRTIESGWMSLRTSALKGINEIVAQVEAVATAIKNAGVETVIAALEQGKAIIAFVRQVIANPDIIIDPIVETVVGLLQDVPAKAKTEAQTRIEEQAGGGTPATAGPSPSPAGAAPGPPVQRLIAPEALSVPRRIQRQAPASGGERTTLGLVNTLSGIGKGIAQKLGALWADLWGQVRKMVVGVLDPREIAKGLGEDWDNLTKELSARAKRIEGIRTDSWGNFFEDLGRFISNILDFPLIVWRTINAMLGRLSVYIGLAIVLGGAVMGAIAAGTGGAIFGSVIPAAGTAGGGAAGILAGAWAGATAGYGAAETVGLVLLGSFLVAEQLSMMKAITDLLNIPQTEDEQNEDINQASDSIVAMVTAAALILIAWMAVSLAKMVFAFIKGIVVRFRGGEPPPETQPKPVDIPIEKKGFAICRSCLDPIKTPPDLLARRDALPTDVGEFLDKKITNNPHIFKDPANPTPEDFKALTGIMDGAAKRGEQLLGPGRTAEEYLEAGLRDQMPKVSAPKGDPDAIAELPRIRREMQQLVDEIEDFAKKNPDKIDIDRAATPLRSILDGTLREMEEGRFAKPIDKTHILGFDGQIKGARGELTEAAAAPSMTKFNQIIDGVEFDQVRPDGSLYQTKSLSAPRGPSAKQPTGNGTYRSAMAQVKQTLEIAERHPNPLTGQPADVTVRFPQGLAKEVAADLRAIEVNGRKATIIAPEVVLQPL